MNKNMKLATEEITDLPTSTIETILTCLPLRDAVRTSILAKRWRYLWENIPKLVFDDTLCQTSAGLARNGRQDTEKLLRIIYQILVLCHGPINEFTLSMSELNSCSGIDPIILNLSRRNTMEKFTLCILKGEPYKVPSSLLSCQKLTHLKLHSCVIDLPSMIGRFSSLISLEFDEVIFTSEMLGKFISNCPLLEEMSLISSRIFDCLELDAPRLRILHFRLELKSLFLKNVTPLVTVSVNRIGNEYHEYPEYPETSNMIQLFDRIPLIENLQIGYHFLKSLTAGGVPYMLPTSLIHLKFLELSALDLGKLDEVSLALCLIRSSPNLENFTLTIYNCTSKDIGLKFLQEQDFSEVILNKLRLVKIEEICGDLPELEFVKILLAKSPNLEKMLIEPCIDLLPDKGLQMLTEMIEFERASSKAKIIFGQK